MKRGDFCGLLLGALLTPLSTGGTIYVNGTAGDNSWDGLCQAWDGATCGPKATIQAGITAAMAGDTVLVAEGTYVGAGNKDVTFEGKSITVRSEQGAASCVIDCENAGRGFIFHNGESQTSILDGVTITHGNAGPGGAIQCDGSSPTIVNCVLRENTASVGGEGPGGGAIGCRRSHPVIRNCTITQNRANNGPGGGISCYGDCKPVITGCTIISNSAYGYYGLGGGFHCEESCRPQVRDCVFADNQTGGLGGAICCVSNPAGFGPITFVNCTILENKAPTGGGAAFAIVDVTMIDCLLQGNAATFWSEHGGGGVWTNCGMLSMERCRIVENTSRGSGGGLYLTCEGVEHPTGLTLNECIIIDNSAQLDGGALWYGSGPGVVLSRCTIDGNTAGNQGGGIYFLSYFSPAITGCLITGNAAVDGGGIGCGICDPRIVSSTIAGNTASGHGSALYGVARAGRLSNCILWNNGDVEVDSAGRPTITYSNVRGGWGGVGNINAAPLFVDPSSGDYHLAPGSPGINAGNDAEPDLPPVDIDGEPRIQQCRVDMGADESPFFPDCNRNGVSDVCDIAGGTSTDCTANGIPDECEADCNANGVPDSCEVVAGTAPDCNHNGVPDECDVASGATPDCNTNGIPDSCDIAAGTARDCNHNGIPDVCDITAGSSTDCEGNGVPDECDPDCNQNGVGDGCDILAGTSSDTNGDGVPDECRRGDANCDGVVNYADINPFVFAYLWGKQAYEARYPNCFYHNLDCDGDGCFLSTDIPAFIRLLARK